MFEKDGSYNEKQKQHQQQFSSGMSAVSSVVFNTSSSQFQQQSGKINSEPTFGTSAFSPFHHGNTFAADTGLVGKFGVNSNTGSFPPVLYPQQQAVSGHSPTLPSDASTMQQHGQHLGLTSQHQEDCSSKGYNSSKYNQSDMGNFSARNESHNVVMSFGTSANLVAPSSSRDYPKFGSNDAGNANSSPFVSEFHHTNNNSTSDLGNRHTSKLVFSQGSNVQTFGDMGRNLGSLKNHLKPLNKGGIVSTNPTGIQGISSSGGIQHSVSANIEMNKEEAEEGIRYGIENSNYRGTEEAHVGIHASSPSFQVVEECSTSGQPPLFRNKEWVNPNSWKKTNVQASTTLEAHEQKAKELAVLRAKLEEKKKKMMEMKLKSQTKYAADENGTFLNKLTKNPELQNRKQMPNYKAQTRSHENEILSSLNHDHDNLSQQTLVGDRPTPRLMLPESEAAATSRASTASQVKTISDSDVKSATENTVPYIGSSELSRSPSRRQSPDMETITSSNKKCSTTWISKAIPSASAVVSVLDSDRNAELMNKNLQRFSQTQNRATVSMLPKELKDHVKSDAGQSFVKREEGKQDASELTTSVDLVGTCVYMCPDEELIRRESENDIQLLELPHSDIHPEGWTLRETAIKRFRRSAADFKLDIPELVRPPHILERVCGYLEEWVMERDRQGDDPRFGGQVPPPLEVYQFIWDRTRMVRKDFILQNYIGTGGRCNAIAVRCHERIARWHAMCEHQLSHLPDFISMQSQQNIQELGATMKSLNMYYDDAAGRSIKDVDPGSSSGLHGCESSTVMGKTPVDYDGQTLRNTCEIAENSSRIIGRVGHSGTAEPEMRGLYILLTMNNDGGMEVLKYAARLLRDRPKIFQSFPVQLALQVYKAKREYNYARFFSLLRSKSTPYLYACIMFKYVESMRKAAFRIMSKTYGTKKKDTGEGLYDQYLLKDLVHLLCFEDEEEARNACEHYNITVKRLPLESTSREHADIIFWRNSNFQEPRDPAKGVLIRLIPKKMNRVIEKKISGATRLAICRGEVSGIGATLEQSISTELGKLAETVKMNEKHLLNAIPNVPETVGVKEEIKEQQVVTPEASMLLPPTNLLDDANRKNKAELQFSYFEQIKDDDVKQWDSKYVKLKRKEEQKQEAKVPQADEEARLKLMQSKTQLEINRHKKEEARQEKMRREAEEHYRLQETQRRGFIAIQKQQAEVERQKRARQAEERRIELEWQLKMEYARKLLTWNKLITRFRVEYLVRMETQLQIESFNPLHRMDFNSFLTERRHVASPLKEEHEKPDSLSTGNIFYMLATDNASPLPLHDILFNELSLTGCFLTMNKLKFGKSVSRNCVMFKLGVSLVGKDTENDLANQVKMWVDQRLKLGHVWSKCEGMDEVRTVTQLYDEADHLKSTDFDAILELNLFDNTPHGINVQPYLGSMHYHKITIGGFKHPGDIDHMLLRGCQRLIHEFTSSWQHCEINKKPKSIEVISIRKLFYFLLRRGLCRVNLDRNGCSEVLLHHFKYDIKGCNVEKLVHHFLEVARHVIEEVSKTQNFGSSWPYDDFLVDGMVPSYFNTEEGLPKKWNKSTDRTRLQEFVWNVFPSLKKEKPIFIDIVHDLIDEAPIDVQRYCSYLLNHDEYIECLETGLQWRESADQYISTNCCNVYLPLGRALFITESYLEQEAIVPQIPTVLQRNDTNLCLDLGTISEKYPSGGLEEDDSDENTTPKNLTIHPTSSHKRPFSADSGTSKNQKKSKVESDELRQSKTFTENLNAMYTKDEGLQSIVNDPLFSKLIASDTFLREFVVQNSNVQRPS